MEFLKSHFMDDSLLYELEQSYTSVLDFVVEETTEDHIAEGRRIMEEWSEVHSPPLVQQDEIFS